MTKKKVIISAGVIVVLLSATAVYLSGYFGPTDSSETRICSRYNEQKNIIQVICDTTLPEIYGDIGKDNVLKRESADGTWFLNSSLIISAGAVLTINSPDVHWIKINSEGRSYAIPEVISSDRDISDSTPYLIHVFGGLDLNGIKITSWSPATGDYSRQKPDGSIPRPYITVEEQAQPSQIADSEIAYLGYNSPRKQGFSFYGGDRSNITGNRIHDLWYGFYSTGVGYIRLENNSIYDNMKYGIDPHTGSHDLLVTNNNIYNSRIGLICSLNCSNLLFENNVIKNNKEVGLMLSKGTVNSTARQNNITSSDTGISVSGSHSNNIEGNTLSQVSDGIAVKNNSSRNIIMDNVVFDAGDCAIMVGLGEGNIVTSNHLQRYKGGALCFSNGANNSTAQSNLIDGLGEYGIDVRGKDTKMNKFIDNHIQLSNSAIRVYNNTGSLFVANKVGNTNDHQYVVSGNSNLTLVKTHFVGDRIRSAGTESNVVTISNSGIIDVTVERQGANDTSTRYDTDRQPYIGNLSYATINLHSR